MCNTIQNLIILRHIHRHALVTQRWRQIVSLFQPVFPSVCCFKFKEEKIVESTVFVYFNSLVFCLYFVRMFFSFSYNDVFLLFLIDRRQQMLYSCDKIKFCCCYFFLIQSFLLFLFPFLFRCFEIKLQTKLQRKLFWWAKSCPIKFFSLFDFWSIWCCFVASIFSINLCYKKTFFAFRPH